MISTTVLVALLQHEAVKTTQWTVALPVQGCNTTTYIDKLNLNENESCYTFSIEVPGFESANHTIINLKSSSTSTQIEAMKRLLPPSILEVQCIYVEPLTLNISVPR
jgi:hypothetical protein